MATILLVDDDADVLNIASQVLQSAQHQVAIAQDAFTAIDMLSEQHFDIVISDANMPLYSGFDLLRTLRKEKRFADLSIVMLTGRRERQDIEKAIEHGVDDYIVKPIDPILFIKKVEAVASKRQARTTKTKAGQAS